MPDLLFELFSEEIPARMQAKAAEDLRSMVTNRLVDAGLVYEGATAFATPRRLALAVQGIPARQPDLKEERKGPRVGAPDAAVQGFLKSAGLASLAEATIQKDPKRGDFYVALIEKPGRAAIDVLAEILPLVIRTFPWPKSMRWGERSARPGALTWVRPLHSIVATFGPETEHPDIVPFAVDGIAAGDITHGHRFLAPRAFHVRHFDDYAAKLEKAKVVLDPARRKDIILADAKHLAFAQGLELVEDPALLDEVAGLVEWPVPLMGSFDAEFLRLPPEVIRATIRINQKCFVVRHTGVRLPPSAPPHPSPAGGKGAAGGAAAASPPAPPPRPSPTRGEGEGSAAAGSRSTASVSPSPLVGEGRGGGAGGHAHAAPASTDSLAGEGEGWAQGSNSIAPASPSPLAGEGRGGGAGGHAHAAPASTDSLAGEGEGWAQGSNSIAPASPSPLVGEGRGGGAGGHAHAAPASTDSLAGEGEGWAQGSNSIAPASPSPLVGEGRGGGAGGQAPSAPALANKFILVANIEASDGGGAIIAGNERVIRARLSDAKFFYETDLKTRLEDRLPNFKDIIFHEKLGTQAERIDRIERLAAELAPLVGADVEKTKRAARLAKADLLTEMVGEFPELQGLMGKYYARAQGEDESVAAACEDHYKPLGPGDRVPTDPVSVAVALADKLDTLVGFWAIDEKPTGSKDPYALRRTALGVIRLILDNGLRVRLIPILDAQEICVIDSMQATARRSGQTVFFSARVMRWWAGQQVSAKSIELLSFFFFADRLKVQLREQGARHDLVDAVFALEGQDDLLLVVRRVEALGKFLDTEDGKNLLAGYKRAANILRIEEKRDNTKYKGAPDDALYRQAEEWELVKAIDSVAADAGAAVAREDYAAAMSAMAKLRPHVDAFFDKVTVNVDDPPVRANRLKLLNRIREATRAVADFAKIEG